MDSRWDALLPDEVIRRDVGCLHRCSRARRSIAADAFPTSGHCGSGQPAEHRRSARSYLWGWQKDRPQFAIIFGKYIISLFKNLFLLYFKRGWE